ncbi:unnamed protein product [Larinioides sclopetarius]|uniref:Tyrosine-protein phosphatase non-receptor type 13 n=1 Tax=Larinioides sclopetarius TaxID=280406 RepID=A0AAV2BR75_9ARAC
MHSLLVKHFCMLHIMVKQRIIRKKLSPLIKTVFQAMCQSDIDLRMDLSDVDQVCSLHAEKYMNGLTFMKAVSKLHQEVLGSLPENEILAQVDQDFMKENDFEDYKDEDEPDTDYSMKYLSYGQRLGYHPEFSSSVNSQSKKRTPKELWKEAYRKVLEQIRKSKKTFRSKEEVLSAWKDHKAHQSIFRVYEELTERRKMLELLRLSINIGPVATADVDKNPLLITGLKPKTIAELVLLLQRPKHATICSKSYEDEPKKDEAMRNVISKSRSRLSSSSFSSLDSESSEKAFYNIDKIALNEPFSENFAFHSLAGPEFIINQLKPHTRISPFCTDKEFHNSAFTVIIDLLNGDSLDIECIPSVTGKQLYQAVAEHLKLRERYLFGLAYMYGEEHIFIDKKQRIFDLLHSCLALSRNRVLIHLRVKFYLNDIHLMRTPSLRHLYYLQLRNDFLEGNYCCDNSLALSIGGLALQAEFGDYDSSVYGKEYFLLEHYLPYFTIERLNRSVAKTKLHEHHLKLEGISKELAELKYIEALMMLPEFGCHFYKVFQDKRNYTSAVWLGIKSIGIQVYDKVAGKRSECQFYPWQNIKRISFCKKYFCISPRAESYSGKHVIYRFFTAINGRSHYLFMISMAYHKFFLKLRTVSKASEIFIEDLDEEYLYFCDKAGMEKEIGCDLYDTKGKFQWKTKTLKHRSSSQNDLEFLNDPYILEASQPKKSYELKHGAKVLNKIQKKTALSNFITRSSSAPNPLKKGRSDYTNKHYIYGEPSRVSSTIPRASCGKRSMRFVKLHKDPKLGFGMVITCGNTYDTILHGAFVESIHNGGPADIDGNICPGDQIMSVNGIDVQNDHFLTVVDLLQGTSGVVDLVIAKGNKFSTDFSDLIKKEISEKPFTQTKTWIVGNEINKDIMPALEKLEVKSNENGVPVPRPRKKWIEQEKSLSFDGPDLTLNHSSNLKSDKKWSKVADNSISGDNIPDIIASQIKNLTSSDLVCRIGVNSDDCDDFLPINKNVDENFLLPGEIFHVVLDKKGGSLGLNIYQGTESNGTEQRHIYIHSVVPNGAADLDGRIKPGDKLLEVDGEPLENLSYQEVVTKLRETQQVAHLVLEKGDIIETTLAENEMIPKKNNQYSKDHCLPNATKNVSKSPIMQNSAFKYSDYILQSEPDIKRKESSASAEACFNLYKDSDSSDQASFSSLPTIANDPVTSVYGAKDNNSRLQIHYTPKRNHNPSSPYAKVTTPGSGVYPFRNPLTSYNSTPNLAENSDEDDKNEMNGCLYRNRSTECLATPHFLKPHQTVLDFYQNYSYVRGSASNLHQIPAVPIRKKKLKRLEDIYNYCNSENTFEVVVQKSSRGLGLSISGGIDAYGRDPFSQLIRIRKLYPLQPALECGQLALGDVILEVNGTKMVGLTNTEALEVLRSAPTEVILKVFRPSKSLIPSFSTFKGGIWPFFDSSSSSASSSLSRTEANVYNVETGEFEVTLVKRGGSLGFTISKKEGPLGGLEEGIYVKALVREPAMSDGRIQPGDKIVKVNGTDVSSMSHAEAIEFMRNTPNSVTLTLYRTEPPLTPGYMDEEYSITKPLRWEAVGLINDRLKQKKNSDENGVPTRKLKRKLGRISNAPSNSSSESSDSSNSSSSQEHVIQEIVEPSDSVEDLSLEGIGLQRNQRPKSLDMLNSSDRKRCPVYTDEESFHRQSSVMCSNVDSKNKNDEGQNDSSSEKAGKNLLKWRGSTLPHTDETDNPNISLDKCSTSIISLENETSVESTSDDEKPVPFPRTTSCSEYWVNTFDVELDRGWHGRLGFSLHDPPQESPDSPRNMLPKAAEVKAVYPGSLADKDGRIKVGDRMIRIINRECLLNKSATEVIEILRRTGGLIRMVFCRLEKRA